MLYRTYKNQTYKSLLLLLLFTSATIFAIAQKKKIVVAKDGTGNYTTVQAAFDAVPMHNTNPITIYVKKGTYKEKLRLDTTKNFVTLIGEDKNLTLLTYDDHTGKKAPSGQIINTYSSASFFMLANDFLAKNISFENNAGFNAGQAVAVYSFGDRAVYRGCRFLGFQDVLFVPSKRSRQYYKNCYIEGTTDFIFGDATALFEDCDIYSKKNSHVTAASTPKENKFGYVFKKCRLTAADSLNKVSLGRPWQPYASVTYIKCYIGAHIIATGWDNWKKPENEKTARYAEYKNYGPGANTSARVNWSRQLTDEEVKEYTMENILSGWKPRKK